MIKERDVFPDVDNTEFHLIKTEEIISKLNKIFLFSLIWSVGVVVDSKGRTTVSNFLKRLLKDQVAGDRRKDKKIKIDSKEQPGLDGYIFHEYMLDEEWEWKLWKSFLKEETPSGLLKEHQNQPIYEIVVDTVESVAITYMLTYAFENDSPMILIGPTGTGKTIYTMKYLKTLPRDKNQLIFIGFSA